MALSPAAPTPIATPSPSFSVKPAPAPLPAQNMSQTTPATLTANFSKPGTNLAPKITPAVISSDAAATHLDATKTEIGKLNNDVKAQNLQKPPTLPVADKPVGADTTPKDTITPDQTASPSLDDKISALLDEMKGTTQAAQEKAKTQGDKLAQAQTDEQSTHDADAAGSAAKLASIANGTYPLTDAEQSILDATKSAYASAIEMQKSANSGYEGRISEYLASMGVDQSSPIQAFGLMHAAISTGVAKIANIESKMMTAIGNLKLKIQQNDYKGILDAQKAADTAFNNRTKSILSLQKEVETQAKDAQTAAKNYATTSIKAIIDSGKFTDTEKKNAADRLYKDGLLSVRQYQAITQRMKTGGGGGTKPTPDKVTQVESWLNETRGEDKYVDPNAYQQAFDAWITDGYQAKDFVKNFPPKVFINPSNAWLPSYLESHTTKGSSSVTTNPFS